MCLEILSSSLMSPYFGGSIYIWGSIISSFMVNMALGYMLGGYISKHTRRASILMGMLMIGSIWVICIPTMYHPICTVVSAQFQDVRLGSLIAMNSLFFLPIMIMSMISPYVIGLLSISRHYSGLRAGYVLFVSTFGAFIGTNITAFYLINMFEVSKIISGSGILCFFLSLTILCMGIDRRITLMTEQVSERR